MKRMFTRKSVREYAAHPLGDVEVDGALAINGALTADSIIENMEGYSFSVAEPTNAELSVPYAGVCKTGNKITFAVSVEITPETNAYTEIGRFVVPKEIYDQLVNNDLGLLATDAFGLTSAGWDLKTLVAAVSKQQIGQNYTIGLALQSLAALTMETAYVGRFEITFLLSENLAS